MFIFITSEYFHPMIKVPQTINATKTTRAIMLASKTKQPVWLAFGVLGAPPAEVLVGDVPVVFDC